MYTNKEDKNTFIMILAILVVSFIALIAIGNIIWRIISPGVNTIVGQVSELIKVNQLDYNFNIPTRRDTPVAVTPTPAPATVDTSTVLTAEQQAVLDRNLSYNFNIPAKSANIVTGMDNYYEEIRGDYTYGEQRITEESDKNILINIPKIALNSPIYQSFDSKTALEFGFWMHKASYKFNEGQMIFLCQRRFFDNNDPRSCYFMNLLNINDEIILNVDNQQITYKVNKIELITSDYNQIYENVSTDKNSIRIVTTGAVDTGKGRLVITATRN